MDWNQHYADQDTPWDLGEPAPPLLHLLDKKAALFQNTATILVPGCGSGHDAIALAEKTNAKVTAIDIAPLALEKARRLDTANTVTWLEADFFHSSPPPAYDLIWEHTCYCAIDPEKRPDYVQSAHRLLKPGGALLGLFFLDTGVENGPPHSTTLDNLKNQFSSHFILEWQDPNPPSTPNRAGREHLILWRKLASC